MKIKLVFKPGGTEWTYEWTGDPDLAVGDEVLCPPGYWNPHGAMQTGIVTSLTSDYTGTCKSIGRRSQA